MAVTPFPGLSGMRGFVATGLAHAVWNPVCKPEPPNGEVLSIGNAESAGKDGVEVKADPVLLFVAGAGVNGVPNDGVPNDVGAANPNGCCSG